MYDENKIWYLLMHSDKAVDRAMVAIYNRQTAFEKSAHTTIGVGFSGADVRLGTYYAKWVLSGKQLTGGHLMKARNMAVKYRKQLTEIANSKVVQADMEERLAIQE